MEDKIISREGGELRGHSVQWASRQEGLWNNLGGTEEQDIQKKKGIAYGQHGLWMVMSRQGQGASGQMAQWLELQSWGVGSSLGEEGRRIILKRQQDTRRTLMMGEGKQTAFGGLQGSASSGRAWFQDEQDSEGNSWRS